MGWERKIPHGMLLNGGRHMHVCVSILEHGERPRRHKEARPWDTSIVKALRLKAVPVTNIRQNHHDLAGQYRLEARQKKAV